MATRFRSRASGLYRLVQWSAVESRLVLQVQDLKLRVQDVGFKMFQRARD